MDKKAAKLVIEGAAAILRTHKHWDDWVAIIPGLCALRKEAEQAGSVGSRPYNEAFGPLLEEHGYGEGLLEKNTQAALLNIGGLPNWKKKLAEFTRDLLPGQVAKLTPRKVWEKIRPDAPPSAAEPEPRERGVTPARLEEENLANRLDLSIELQGDYEIADRIAELYADPKLRPRLREVYEKLRELFEAEQQPVVAESRTLQ